MGDRGNVFILESDFDDTGKDEIQAKRGIWIYGHWSGYSFPLTVRDTIKKHGGGASVRAVLCEAMKKCYGETEEQMREALTDDLCFSIGLAMQDNEYPITVVDNFSHRVGFSKEPKAPFQTPPEPEVWIPFKEFCAMGDDDIRKVFLSFKRRD